MCSVFYSCGTPLSQFITVHPHRLAPLQKWQFLIWFQNLGLALVLLKCGKLYLHLVFQHGILQGCNSGCLESIPCWEVIAYFWLFVRSPLFCGHRFSFTTVGSCDVGFTIDVGFEIIIMTKEGCLVIDGLIQLSFHSFAEDNWCGFDQFV